jgi:O-acetyl-ADP-ribose deacetylase (regulator of RNase III)
MEIIEGNILKAKETYLVQQCNCLTVTSHGLSKTLAKTYSWGDPYRNRKSLNYRNCAVPEDRDKPGTIKILQSPDNTKAIICMFAQWAPGKPQRYKSYPDIEMDTYSNRQKWFQECLERVEKINVTELAFPWKIGCGLAGGNWNKYYNMIKAFSDRTGIKCTLYRI